MGPPNYNNAGKVCTSKIFPENTSSEMMRKEGRVKVWAASLAGVAQWIERRPVSQKVTGSIPSQATCLGCGPGPQLGAYKRQPIDVFLTH